MAPLGRGKPHPQPCGWLEYRENVFKLASIDQRTQEILASRIIGCKLEDMSPEEDTIVLATRGPNSLRLPRPKVSPSKENKARFSDQQVPVEEFSRLAQAANLKAGQVETVAGWFRSVKGRNSVEPGLKPKLQEKSRLLEPYFTISKRDMDSSLKADKEKGDMVRFQGLYFTLQIWMGLSAKFWRKWELRRVQSTC